MNTSGGPADPQWRKSSHSGSGNDTCVEVAALGTKIGLRDSKNPNAPTLTVPRHSFQHLTNQIRLGRYDL